MKNIISDTSKFEIKKQVAVSNDSNWKIRLIDFSTKLTKLELFQKLSKNLVVSGSAHGVLYMRKIFSKSY